MRCIQREGADIRSYIKVPKIKSYVPEINTSGVLCLRQPTGQDIHAKETASSGTAEGQREVVTMKTAMYTFFYSVISLLSPVTLGRKKKKKKCV